MRWNTTFSFIALLLVLSGRSGGAAEPTQLSMPESETHHTHARQAWTYMDKHLKSSMNKMVRKALPTLMKEVYKKEVSAPCMGALMAFSKALRETKLWAFKMLDSTGKFPEGFLRGTLTSLGNYDECVNIDMKQTKLKLQGQYCVVELLPPLPAWKPFTSAHFTVPEMVNISAPDTVVSYLMSFIHNLHVTSIKIGICMPSRCTFEDVDKLVDIVPEKLGISWKFSTSHCNVKSSVEFTNVQLVVLYVMGFIVFFVVLGTAVDKLWTSQEMEKPGLISSLFHVAKSFSFSANAKKLCSYTHSEIAFAHGIVVFAFIWLTMANTFIYANYDVASNFMQAMDLLKHIYYESVLNRILPLQTLFYLSGFISTYKCLKSPEKGLNVFRFFLKKYWKYTPAYALTLALIILTPTWGSGPFWDNNLNPVYKNCQNNWWYNVLYINNFLKTNNMCLSHTWIFAVAAQLHVLGVVVLIPLKLRPKIGLMVNFVLFVASLASIALTNVYYDLPPNEMTAILHERDRNFYSEHSNYRLYTHVAVYCSGVFVGYLMAHHRQIKISKRMSCFLWLLTVTGMLAILGSVHEWRMGEAPSPLLSAVYATFSKVALGAFLSWLTVACMVGRCGGIGSVLGWRPFAFLSRLTFLSYLMHVPIMNMVMSFKKAAVFVCEMEIYYIALSHVAGSYIIAYVLYMFFKAPWLSLTDVLGKRCKGRNFNTKVEQTDAMTEKPVRFSAGSSSEKCMDSLEKGQN